jgi:hypothetical protein
MENNYGREVVATATGDPIADQAMDLKRPLSLRRPCRCGCDSRGGEKGVGYVTGGSGKHFVSVWLEHEDVYQALQAIFWAHNLPAEV